MGLYTQRRIANGIVMSLSIGATAFGLLWLVLVLWTLLENGVAAITPSRSAAAARISDATPFGVALSVEVGRSMEMEVLFAN